MLEYYHRKGYSDSWINQRLQSIEIRKELTDEWDARGVQKGVEYAILTDEITKAWSGMNTRQYKNLKGLKKENLRDNMTNTELVLNMLAELSTKKISEAQNPESFNEHMEVARKGGSIAKDARLKLEQETGEKVVTPLNAKDVLGLQSGEVEDVDLDSEESK